jgi:hypothetical protein
MNLFGNLSEVLRTEAKLLAFQPVKPDMARQGHLYLSLGFLSAWLVGVGRYWDNPRAELWQHLGLGSVLYIMILAALLWLIILPLRPRNWSYLGVLTFVGLTSPPALLYAVPVERFFTLDTAQTINVWFLAVVAGWRVILLFIYLRKSAGLSRFATFVATFLPLVLIVTVLAFLNLEHVVFRIMGGLADDERSGNDSAYLVLLMLTWISVSLAPVLLIGYGWLSWDRWRSRSARAEGGTARDAP